MITARAKRIFQITVVNRDYHHLSQNATEDGFPIEVQT